jgi:hypothetical protein
VSVFIVCVPLSHLDNHCTTDFVGPFEACEAKDGGLLCLLFLCLLFLRAADAAMGNPAGSGIDAVLKRRNDGTVRALILKMYRAIGVHSNTSSRSLLSVLASMSEEGTLAEVCVHLCVFFFVR